MSGNDNDECDDDDGHSNGHGVGHDEHGNGNGYGHDEACPCFAEGTLLSLNGGGIIAVEDIREGDDLMTVSGTNGKVLWVGSSDCHDPMYGIYHPNWGGPVVVTKNHGISVDLLDGTRGLAAAKFLTDAQYGDFMVAQHVGETHRVYHVMLCEHELLVTSTGLHSESYYGAGWDTHPEAEAILHECVGDEEMQLVYPRVKRRDVDQIIGIRMWNFPRRYADECR